MAVPVVTRLTRGLPNRVVQTQDCSCFTASLPDAHNVSWPRMGKEQGKLMPLDNDSKILDPSEGSSGLPLGL